MIFYHEHGCLQTNAVRNTQNGEDGNPLKRTSSPNGSPSPQTGHAQHFAKVLMPFNLEIIFYLNMNFISYLNKLSNMGLLFRRCIGKEKSEAKSDEKIWVCSLW